MTAVGAKQVIRSNDASWHFDSGRNRVPCDSINFETLTQAVGWAPSIITRLAGPCEAKCFAYLANRIRVEFVLRSNQRHFCSPPLAVYCQSSVTLSASFMLGIEATPL